MSPGEQREEVQRVLQSPQFRRAPKLQRFLGLVCDYYFHDRLTEITEFLIATEAFGKSPNFDPGQDSLVRVQAREVRRRLHEYYQKEGRESRVILDLPVGGYAPVFTPVAPPAPVRSRPPIFKTAWFMLAATAVACLALLLAADQERRLLLRSSAAAADRLSVAALPPQVSVLWNRFLESEVATLLVVSNPDVGPCTEQANPRGICPDEYTGMGEAVAIHLITNLFKTARQTLAVKQSRMVNAEDVKRYNLILVGGKQVNVWTRRLGAGLNLNPGDPAAPHYETAFDAETGQLTKDRALIAVRRNPDTGHWMMFLYGRHSQGTHAAAEASTDAHFLSQLHWPASPFPESFRVLVGVSVNDGIPEVPVPVAVRVP